MRIGGFVQLKCLAKIHTGRRSFIRKTSNFDIAATTSSYPTPAQTETVIPFVIVIETSPLELSCAEESSEGW